MSLATESSTVTSDPEPPKDRTPARREQARGIATREALVDAALSEFGERGFDGTSVRAIARRAGVGLAALTYHFEKKELLWRAAADHLFGLYGDRLEARARGLEGVDEATTQRLLMREAVLFAAEHPELHRFMLQAGATPGPRLEWLVERHVRPQFSDFRRMMESPPWSGRPWAGSATHLYYMIIGAAATIYSVAPACKLVTGDDPTEPDLVEAHVDAILELFFPTPPQDRDASADTAPADSNAKDG